ncbi:MAG: hypothetical protein EOM25_13480 [Deltaproteobacteria bacterium]|nr:hypothetical protein [Deltaproteobacteria bacterium]
MNDINETVAEVLRFDEEATPGPWTWTTPPSEDSYTCVWDDYGDLVVEGNWEGDTALIAYYRTAAPALAREVQRLQGEVRIDADALVEMMEESRRVGQEAMRERCAQWLEQRGDHVWAKALRALEVE